MAGTCDYRLYIDKSTNKNNYIPVALLKDDTPCHVLDIDHFDDKSISTSD